MIEEGKTYEVYDGEGRCWGSVCLVYPHTIPTLDSNTISGRLEASPEFKEVQHIFLEHDKFMTEIGDVDDEENNSNIIASLGVVLLDLDTGVRQNVCPVFVSEELLFTCNTDVNEI